MLLAVNVLTKHDCDGGKSGKFTWHFPHVEFISLHWCNTSLYRRIQRLMVAESAATPPVLMRECALRLALVT